MLKLYKINDLLKNDAYNINMLSSENINVETYKYIEFLKNKFEMKHVFIDVNEKTQVVFLKKCGTNGKECSIKNSLLEVYFLMDQLEKEEKINWVQVLDVEIDNADDVYYFSITFTLK